MHLTLPAPATTIPVRSPAWAAVAGALGSVGSHRLLALVLLLATTLFAAGCGNAEFDQVRAYKDFLVRAKPSLQGMNKVREELFNADSVETMIVKFESGLVPNVQALHDLADAEQVTDGHLAELHANLQKTMDAYLTATKTLVTKLKAAKGKGGEDAAYYSAVEKAMLEWGARDKDFGDQMSNLVSDLNSYLDKLVKS